jgi:hypothetical protein
MTVGVKPKEKVKRAWSQDLAYAIGLLATDGCLSSDGRHFDLTSKDKVQLRTFLQCLNLKNKIGYKYASHNGKRYPRVQFGDVIFYQFLLGIGLMPAKTKIIGKVDIPDKYFFDFLRGHFDGDGTFYSYYDPRWKSSFMFYAVFISASKKHIDWIRKKLSRAVKVKGHINRDQERTVYQLKYAKKESLKVLRRMYYNSKVICLNRKRRKIERALKVIGASLPK